MDQAIKPKGVVILF